MEGIGIFFYSNSAKKYEGEWKDGKCEGTGIYYDKNGSKYDGKWKDM